MKSWAGAGRPSALAGCPTLSFSNLAYPIFRGPHPRGPGTSLLRRPDDPRSIESTPRVVAPSLVAPRVAAAPRPLEPLLAAEVPVALDDLWSDLIDHRNGLLVALHAALDSPNFAAAAPPVPPPAEALAAADLVLTFTTPLPLAGLAARNTEALVARRTGRGAFTVASVCATQGVPMASAFVNKLLWEANASGATTTSLRISACTEFTAPVLGLIRSQIERESLKGMRESYATLADLLRRRYPAPPAAAVTNLRRPAAMSSPMESTDPPPPFQSVSGETEGEGEDAGPGLALRRPRRRRRPKPKKATLPAAAPPAAAAASTDLDLADPTDPEESDEDEEDLVWERRPHRATLRSFKAKGDLAEIKRAVAERWPAWARSRYWLLVLGPHGGVRGVDGAPTPDEAIGLLWAVGVAMAGARQSDWQNSLPKDPLVRGLVEAMRILPPRVPSGAAAGDVGPRRFSAAADDDPASAISPAAVSSAMFVLGWLGGDGNWAAEMEALCERLPTAEFRRVLQVYNAVWALRATRHWTARLSELEARTVELLRRMQAGDGAGRLSTRHVRHAGFVAQALVHLGHVPKDLFEAVTPLVSAFWDWRAACSLAWAVAIANELESPLVGALLTGVEDNAAEGVSHGLPRRASLSKLWQLLASLDRLAPAAAARAAAWTGPAATLAATARAEWEHLVKLESKHTSGAQRDVYNALLMLGYGGAQLESTAASLSVDVAVPEARLAVEVDGFAHFARNRGDMTVGNSLWKRRLLQAHGWIVVNVNVTDWTRTRGAGQRREMLKASIEREEAAARAGKGAKGEAEGQAVAGAQAAAAVGACCCGGRLVK